MNVLDVPLVAIGVVLTVLVFAFGVRRLLGLRLSPLRTLIAALIALFSASPIITAMAGSAVSARTPASCRACGSSSSASSSRCWWG